MMLVSPSPAVLCARSLRLGAVHLWLSRGKPQFQDPCDDGLHRLVEAGPGLRAMASNETAMASFLQENGENKTDLTCNMV